MENPPLVDHFARNPSFSTTFSVLPQGFWRLKFRPGIPQSARVANGTRNASIWQPSFLHLPAPWRSPEDLGCCRQRDFMGFNHQQSGFHRVSWDFTGFNWIWPSTVGFFHGIWWDSMGDEISSVARRNFSGLSYATDGLDSIRCHVAGNSWNKLAILVGKSSRHFNASIANCPLPYSIKICGHLHQLHMYG